MPDELPIAQLLKNKGYPVVLLDESGRNKQPDAMIEGQIFDFKNLRTTTNYFQRIKKDCQNVLGKECFNVIISLDKDFSDEELNGMIRRLAGNPQVNRLEKVWFILNNQLLKFDLSDYK